MEPRPIQRPNERTLAYYHRVNEWEARMKPLMAAEARAIDSANRKGAITTNRVVSRQRELDRKSIHDYAQENPVLLRLLRQKPHLL
jgi:hypothetical protein